MAGTSPAMTLPVIAGESASITDFRENFFLGPSSRRTAARRPRTGRFASAERGMRLRRGHGRSPAPHYRLTERTLAQGPVFSKTLFLLCSTDIRIRQSVQAHAGLARLAAQSRPYPRGGSTLSSSDRSISVMARNASAVTLSCKFSGEASSHAR
jgi:hypothetical protein